jgi:hypothetical protein
MKQIFLFVVILVGYCVAQQVAQLTLGIPSVKVAGAAKQWSYFFLKLDEITLSSAILEFSITSYSGNVDMVISTSILPTSLDCEGCKKANGNIIEFSKQGWQNDKKYFVGVYSTTDSLFSVTSLLSGGT